MFNKKNLNKFIASCISIATIAIPMSITANASTYSRLIDNDPTSSSGNSSSNSGFSYISGGSCYNGDARIISSGNASSFYHWIHPKISLGGVKTVSVSLQVYLSDSRFTDPSAKYTVYKNGASLTVGYINQNTAAVAGIIELNLQMILLVYGLSVYHQVVLQAIKLEQMQLM